MAYFAYYRTNRTTLHVIVLRDNGKGPTSGVIAGINWAFQQAKASGRPSVVTMSLGGSRSAAMDATVLNAINGGLSFAIAAGNDNKDANNTSPARVPGANTVGAVDDNNKKAWFSNFGPCITVWAPGVGILSAWIDGPNSAKKLDGTSMATYVDITRIVVFRQAYLPCVDSGPALPVTWR